MLLVSSVQQGGYYSVKKAPFVVIQILLMIQDQGD